MQYLLVGLALCLFYILLISLSEQISFNYAYLISAAIIILMITFYSTAVFKSRKFSIFLFLLLAANYSFVFVTLQLSEYALLLGSIGLTLILGLTMYFTRKVNWYGDPAISSWKQSGSPVQQPGFLFVCGQSCIYSAHRTNLALAVIKKVFALFLPFQNRRFTLFGQ